ncbi:MAG: 2-amino-4-hydroxy-6-hydroxymethyldihydropteridine diphosphokinase [Betaproteobacteria bacterium]
MPYRFRHSSAASLAYVGIGSNLAHPRRQLARAIAEMARLPRTRVAAVSPNYVSAPLDASGAQPDYVNAVAALVTALPAPALLKRMRAIEHRHGRPPAERRRRNAARTLDLDLLLFGRRRSRIRQLTLPHPRMHQRAFVLKPLLDIAPSAVIPGRGAARRWLRQLHGQRIARTRRHIRS